MEDPSWAEDVVENRSGRWMIPRRFSGGMVWVGVFECFGTGVATIPYNPNP